MERIWNEILAFTLLICMVLAGAQIVHADSSHTYTVWPTGHDDTANIQAAFNACTSSHSSCTVQLEKGTYYTAQITVYDFRGSFLGMGQGVTIIQALPNLPISPQYNTQTTGWWTALPGPTNPWPDMFTFVNGAFTISGMTVTDPYKAPSQGWVSWWGPTVPWLFAQIDVTGEHASVSVDHVTATGVSWYDKTFQVNSMNGFTYGGNYNNLFTPSGYLSGTLSVTNSVFKSECSGVSVGDLANSEVTISSNVMDKENNQEFTDLSNTQVLFTGNQISDVANIAGVWVIQQYVVATKPSTITIANNQFYNLYAGANGIYAVDEGPTLLGTPSVLNVVAYGNVFQTDTTCSPISDNCYNPANPKGYSVIVGDSLKSITLSGNTILNGGAAGIYITDGPGVVRGNTITGTHDGVWLNATSGVHVTGNIIKNSVQWGIALTKGSSNNVIAGNLIKNSGQFDLYWDQTGSGNVWKADVCQTSSPPGLCQLH